MINDSGAEVCDATGVQQSSFGRNKIIHPANDKSFVA
jgi:hypothetical protein